jgi:hypothetical protein
MGLRRAISLTGCAVLACVTTASAQPGTLGSNELFFSTPTLNNAVPAAFGRDPRAPRAMAMHEDDWRQFEFVGARFRPEIESEIRSIAEIWARHSVRLTEGTVFRKVHVRKLIPAPLSIPFTRVELSALFKQQLVPVTLREDTQLLRDVHSVRSGRLTFYGQITAGRLRTFGLALDSQPPLQEDVAALLEPFIKRNNLLLVHWPSRTVFASPEAAMTYLRGRR